MALFTIGNFVSKILVMLLVPLYTNVLSTGEYGVADGLQTTLLLLVPLLTMNAGEAALRFGIEHADKRPAVLKVMLKYTVAADAFVCALCAVGYFICRLVGKMLPMFSAGLLKPEMYFLLFELLFVCSSLYEGMILYCQGCEQVKVMIGGSVLCTVLLIGSNVLFLLVFKIGLTGYLVSQMIAYAGAGLMMLLLIRRMVSGEEAPSAELDSEMNSYGRSMMLYSTSSWANNAIDRYFVLAMCGAAVNGLYAVAYKIPAILTVLQRIFAQAWQISANKTYDDEDSAVFFSHVYEGYQSVMTFGCSFLILALKPICYLLFAKEFYNAWSMVPPLLISVIFGALTGFLGSICLAFKDGAAMGKATGIGALVNIVLNFILIRKIGAMGAAMATMISYFTMFFFSHIAVGKHVKLQINRVRDMLAYLFILVQMLFVSASLPYNLPVSVLCFAVITLMYAGRLFGLVRERFFAHEDK